MTEKTLTELNIWTGVIAPEDGDLPPINAKIVLNWKFNDDAKIRMSELADRNNKGLLSEAEREELEGYVNVGQVIDVLQAKARLSLKRAGANGND